MVPGITLIRGRANRPVLRIWQQQLPAGDGRTGEAGRGAQWHRQTVERSRNRSCDIAVATTLSGRAGVRVVPGWERAHILIWQSVEVSEDLLVNPLVSDVRALDHYSARQLTLNVKLPAVHGRHERVLVEHVGHVLARVGLSAQGVPDGLQQTVERIRKRPHECCSIGGERAEWGLLAIAGLVDIAPPLTQESLVDAESAAQDRFVCQLVCEAETWQQVPLGRVV